VLGAKRSGITKILLPKRNEIDLDDIPKEVRDTMTFVPVEELSQVFEQALGEPIITPVLLDVSDGRRRGNVVPMRRSAAKRREPKTGSGAAPARRNGEVANSRKRRPSPTPVA
jgi:predicted ATP-dependent protease